jgi:hypothetical protein
MQLKRKALHQRLRKLGFSMKMHKRHEFWSHPSGMTISLHLGTKPRYRHMMDVEKRIKQVERELGA